MSLLVEDWVSRAAALQRRGRAGRVRPGTCFCLYTKERFETKLRRYQVPEMSRVPLEELILQIHLMHLGPARRFLESVIEPPPVKAITASVAALVEVGALLVGPAAAAAIAAAAGSGGGGGVGGAGAQASSSGRSSSSIGASAQSTGAAAPAAAAADKGGRSGTAAGAAEGGGGEDLEVLTPLGRHLAMLPLDPRLGKLLVMGASLGCLAPALVSQWVTLDQRGMQICSNDQE